MTKSAWSSKLSRSLLARTRSSATPSPRTLSSLAAPSTLTSLLTIPTTSLITASHNTYIPRLFDNQEIMPSFYNIAQGCSNIIWCPQFTTNYTYSLLSLQSPFLLCSYCCLNAFRPSKVYIQSFVPQKILFLTYNPARIGISGRTVVNGQSIKKQRHYQLFGLTFARALKQFFQSYSQSPYIFSRFVRALLINKFPKRQFDITPDGVTLQSVTHFITLNLIFQDHESLVRCYISAILYYRLAVYIPRGLRSQSSLTVVGYCCAQQVASMPPILCPRIIQFSRFNFFLSFQSFSVKQPIASSRLSGQKLCLLERPVPGRSIDMTLNLRASCSSM